MARYALLRHTDAPDDPSGCHFDLLLEDGDACRTWRLAKVPALNGNSSRLCVSPPIGWCGWSPAVPPFQADAGGRSASSPVTSAVRSRTTPRILWR